MELEVKVKKLHERAELPSYAKPGDAGCDVKCVSFEYDEEHDTWVYHTGLAFEIPKGYFMFGVPRSSNTKTDVYLPNSPGTIDSGYRGEVIFKYKNRDYDELNVNKAPYEVGDRIGQLIILPYPIINYVESDELAESERGDGGFGSTGK